MHAQDCRVIEGGQLEPTVSANWECSEESILPCRNRKSWSGDVVCVNQWQHSSKLFLKEHTCHVLKSTSSENDWQLQGLAK